MAIQITQIYSRKQNSDHSRNLQSGLKLRNIIQGNSNWKVNEMSKENSENNVFNINQKRE